MYKISYIFLRFIICIFIINYTLSGVFSQNTFNKVDSLVSIGQPNAALSELKKIELSALEKCDNPLFFKTLKQKLEISISIDFDSYSDNINYLDSLSTSNNCIYKPLIYLSIADLYASYNNVYTDDSQRNQNAEKFYNEALKTISSIADTPLSDYLYLLNDTTSDKELIKFGTLYDFVILKTIGFYSTINAGIGFNYTDNYSLLGLPNAFGKVDINTLNISEESKKTLTLYQKLESSNLNNPDLLIYITLLRLDYVKDNITINNSEILYLNTLNNLLLEYKQPEIISNITYKKALFFYNQGLKYIPQKDEALRWDIKKSAGLCEYIIKTYPQTDGADNCKTLLNIINSKELSIQTEEVIPVKTPVLGLITVKNCPKVFIRVIKADYNNYFTDIIKNSDDLSLKYYNQNYIKQIESQTLFGDDKRQHSIEFEIPPLEKGYYILITSADSTFSNPDQTTASKLLVSDISYVTRNISGSSYSFYILNRISGLPIKNAKITIYCDFQRNGNKYEELYKTETDATGLAVIPNNSDPNFKKPGNYIIEIRHKDDILYSKDYIYYYKNNNETSKELKSYILTDRAIYRPGQTIYYKIIVTEGTKNNWNPKTEYKSALTIRDVNYNIIAEKKFQTDDYGSASGTYIIPDDILPGTITLRSDQGSAYIDIENYKLPSFEITIGMPESEYKAGDTITINGQSKAYSGFAITYAKVKYNITVTERNFFSNQRKYNNSISNKTIAEGEISSDAEGNFKFCFPTIPYLNKNTGVNTYLYNITVIVTDMTGETQQAEKTLLITDQSLFITTDLPKQIDIAENKNIFNIKTSNANGSEVPTEVNIKIFSLQQPATIFKQRYWQVPDMKFCDSIQFVHKFPTIPFNNENNPENYKILSTVEDFNIYTDIDTTFNLKNLYKWKSGFYKAVFSAKDKNGKTTENTLIFTIFDSNSKKENIVTPLQTYTNSTSLQPGETAQINIGSSYNNAYITYAITMNDQVLTSGNLKLNNSETKLEIPIKEEYRGGIFVNIIMVKENRIYLQTLNIQVPFDNKKLIITSESIKNKVTPNSSEEWTLTFKTIDGQNVKADAVATMYDASLDIFRQNKWNINPYYYNYNRFDWNYYQSFGTETEFLYYPNNIYYEPNNFYNFTPIEYGFLRNGSVMYSQAQKATGINNIIHEVSDNVEITDEANFDSSEKTTSSTNNIEIPLRANFNETAFFYPSLITDNEGNIKLRFTMPDAITKWRIMTLGYTKDFKIGYFEKEIVSLKDLIISANAPRYLRTGDKPVFAARITNLTADKISAETILSITDALTGEQINVEKSSQTITVDPSGNSLAQWNLSIPDNTSIIRYTLTTRSKTHTDAETGLIPILQDKVLFTETKSVEFNKSGEKVITTDNNNFKNITVEFTTNPIWYVVQAIPGLIQIKNNSILSLTNAYYASKLSSEIINDNPEIKDTFEIWKTQQNDALKSPLEQNQELKSLNLSQTIWSDEALIENENKNKLALLFEKNNIINTEKQMSEKIISLQDNSGAWSWFEGFYPDLFITEQILVKLGKLTKLGLSDNKFENVISKALDFTNAKMFERYNILKKEKDQNITGSDIEYLYSKSYFPQSDTDPKYRDMLNFYIETAGKSWVKQPLIYQSKLAIIMKRFGKESIAQQIIASIKDRAVKTSTQGIYWKNNSLDFTYNTNQLITQSAIYEAFVEIEGISSFTEGMLNWLINNKEVNGWSSDASTAEACYCILKGKKGSLNSKSSITITNGDNTIFDSSKQTSQAGTGYIKKVLTEEEIKTGNNKITFKYSGDNSSYGSVYYQYYKNINDVKPLNNGLTLKRELYKITSGLEGTGTLIQNDEILSTGDIIKVKLTFSTDREISYMAITDMRSAALEPVDYISGYRYFGNISGYMSINDDAVNFFIDKLAQGTYSIEYTLKVTQEGTYSNGFAEIQSYYAPQFKANSQSITLDIK